MTQLATYSLDLEISGPEGHLVLKRLVSPVTIGRAEGNTVVLPHDDVSRKHAVVEFLADGLAVHDFSTNGTFIEGRRVEGSGRASMGRPIRMGPYLLRFQRAGAGPQQVVSGEASVRTAPVREEPQLSAVVVEDALLAEHTSTRSPEASAAPASSLSLVPPASSTLTTSSAPPHEAEEGPTGVWDQRAEERASSEVAPSDPTRAEADGGPELGPFEEWLKDDKVSEILVVDRAHIYVEREGRLVLTEVNFASDEALRGRIERLLAWHGCRLAEGASLVEARLQDGTQVSIAFPPVALRGPCLVLRKPTRQAFQLEELVAQGSLDERMARFLGRAVAARRNILVSGGARAGKTVLLQALAAAIPAEERIFTMEEAPELRLGQPHVVALAAQPADRQGQGQGRGERTVRDLLRSALRMRPERLVVGECRGGEVIELLAALDAGHDGTLTTLQAGSAAAAMTRLELLALGAGSTLPLAVLRAGIARTLHLVVHVVRLGDGARRVAEIDEVVGVGGDGAVRLEPIFCGPRRGQGNEFRATGYRPSFLEEFIALGLASAADLL